MRLLALQSMRRLADMVLGNMIRRERARSYLPSPALEAWTALHVALVDLPADTTVKMTPAWEAK